MVGRRLPLMIFVLGSIAYGDDVESLKRKDVEFSADTDFETASKAVQQFQAAIRSRDCIGVAEMTVFPLIVNYEGSSRTIDDESAFCNEFESLFRPARVRPILEQVVLEMAGGWRGLSFGYGDFWLFPNCIDIEEHYSCRESEGYKLNLYVINERDM